MSLDDRNSEAWGGFRPNYLVLRILPFRTVDIEGLLLRVAVGNTASPYDPRLPRAFEVRENVLKPMHDTRLIIIVYIFW